MTRSIPHPTYPDQKALPIAALGHGFSEELLRDLLSAISPPGSDMDELQTCRTVAAVTELDSFRPRTHLEAMLAVQAIACHHAAMDCFKRACLPDQPDDIAIRLRKTAAAMMRAMVDAAKTIEKLQAKPVPTHEPDGATDDQPTPTDTDGIERAFASIMPMERQPMDEAFVRERIARARKAIMEERGIEGAFPPEADPFSAEALKAALRANQQNR